VASSSSGLTHIWERFVGPFALHQFIAGDKHTSETAQTSEIFPGLVPILWDIKGSFRTASDDRAWRPAA